MSPDNPNPTAGSQDNTEKRKPDAGALGQSKADVAGVNTGFGNTNPGRDTSKKNAL